MMPNAPIALLIIVSLVVAGTRSAHAFDEDDTHPRLTGVAVDHSSVDAALKNELGISTGLTTRLSAPSGAGTRSVRQWLQLGSTFEDRPMCRRQHVIQHDRHALAFQHGAPRGRCFV